MKILQICAAYKPAYVYGGPTMSVSMLSEQLAKAGVGVEVYATTANGKTELNVEPNATMMVDGVAVTYFKRLTKDHSHFSPAMLKRLWKEVQNFDAVHIHAWWNLVSLFCCLVALLRGRIVIVSPRGTLSAYAFGNKNTGFKWLIHQLLGKPMLNRSHIHVTSKNEEDAINRILQPKSLVNLPNFVKLPAESFKTDDQTGAVFKMIFLSRIEEKKGLDILINALLHINSTYTLTIAGDGNDDYINNLKQLAAERGVDKYISWIGFQKDDKFNLLAKHDLLVLPSHDENFGNVVIESLSQGTGVLISKFVGLADYVTENRFGWICEADSLSVAEKINYISQNSDQLGTIVKTAPYKIRADFDETNLTAQYVKMYENILNRSSRKGKIE